MGFFSGRHGSLRLLGKPVAKVRNWNLTLTQELLDTTKVDDYAPTFVPGVRSGSGSTTVFYYRPDAVGHDITPFTELIKALVTPGMPTPTDRVQLDLRTGEKEGFTVNAYITSARLGSASGELASVDIDFTVDGDLVGGLS
jgi:hypothetical protein